MKLAILGPTHPFRGGIAHHTTGLVRHLRQRHDVTFVTYRRQYPAFLYPGRTDRDPSRQPALVDIQQRIDVLNPLDWLVAARRIRAEQPDALVLPWTVPYWAPFLATVAGSVRRNGSTVVVFDCHNVLPHEPGPLDTVAARLAFRQADAFLVHSETDRAALVRNWPSAAVGRVPLPLPALATSAPPRDLARRLLGFASTERIVLFFGFVRPYKGLKHLIQAIAKVRRSLDLRLLVAGEFWEPRAQYDRLIGGLGLNGAVTIVDRYLPDEEAVRYVAAADVVVLPHVSATQSGVVPLAFAAGRPVIATTAGGLPEVVEHGQTGLLVPPADSTALAEALIACFSGDLVERLATNVRARSVASGWDRFEQGLLQVIQQTRR